MTFWTSQDLEDRLPTLIDNFSVDNVDCNAYRLSIGDEIYISPTDQTPNPKTNTIRKLRKDEAFTIPPGQFAFLITDETIRVPPNAMAFISMRAKVKLKGLINISGFHVDPGFRGPLTFSVFNAGPTPVHLRRGQECFLIWYASLSGDSNKRKEGPYGSLISTDLVNAIPGELQTLEGLNRKIGDTERRLNERISQLEPKIAESNSKRAMLIGLGVAILALLLKVVFDDTR